MVGIDTKYAVGLPKTFLEHEENFIIYIGMDKLFIFNPFQYTRSNFNTCPCSARGITVQGHPAQGARWWSRLFHINRVSNFSRESISSNCILDKQIIIFSISLNILPELKLSEHETNMIILTFIHFFFILLLQSRHFELTRVYCKFFF